VDETDDNTIWAIDQFNRQLLRIPIGAGVTPPASLADIGQYPVPDPGCNAAGDVRPFALETYQGKIYVGLVCSAESSADPADIQAHIYEFDPVTNTYSSAPVFSILDMTYERGCTVGPGLGPPGAFPCGGNASNGVERRSAGWFPWTSDPADYPRSGGDIGHGTPILSDIEFDDDGNIIIGFRDRAGDQTGWEVRHPDPTFMNNIALEAQGEMLLACNNGDGSWTLENNGSAGCASGTSMGINNGYGPGGGEFFWGEAANDPAGSSGHPESSHGGLVYQPGTGLVITSMVNPVPRTNTDAFRDGGIRWLSMNDGSPQRAYRVYNGSSSEGNTFDKGAGLGDLELLNPPAPLEIGNYVWCDYNTNGLQEAGEDGIDGITIQLYDSNDVLVGVTTTANSGQYYFNETNVDVSGVSADGSTPNSGTFTGMAYNTDYTIVFGDGQFSGGMFTTSMGDFGITPTVDANGNADDNIDSDVAPGSLNANNLPFLAITTGSVGCAVHTYDLGLNCNCEFEVELCGDQELCATAVIDLTGFANAFTPSLSTITAADGTPFRATWTTSGTGTFNGMDLDSDPMTGDYATATTYTPSAADRAAGQVMLTLTTDDLRNPPFNYGKLCEPDMDEVVYILLKVDCGTFPWDGD
ncbi:MAG: SdrD B-like domain-containing protein, partial [Bacteroidota bacterium]